VNFSSVGSNTPEPSESITYNWDFGDGTSSIEPNPTHTFTAARRYSVVLTVTSSSGKSDRASATITAGNTSPKVTVTTPVAGGTFAFGDTIPYAVTVTDAEDGGFDCNRVTATYVLGHDTHGHAEEDSPSGCTGVLHTDPTDVFHGGNVFGVISATYTDRNQSLPLSATGQQTIRQKHQEVEVAVNQSGTNTAATSDVGGGTHRGSIAAGDWIQLNGPFNLVNINSITFRVADAAAGRTAGTPLAAVDVRQDSITGPVIATANLTSTGGTTVWSSQTVPIAMSGLHEVFLTFREVPTGATGGNLFNLNWTEFVGKGIAQ
jgi:PKD repeat protein